MNKILSRKKFVALRCSVIQILSSVKFWIFRSCQLEVVPPLLPSPPEPWPSMTSASTGGPDWSPPPPDWRSLPGVPSSRRSWPPSGYVTAARNPPPSSSLTRTRPRTLSRRCSSPWVSGLDSPDTPSWKVRRFIKLWTGPICYLISPGPQAVSDLKARLGETERGGGSERSRVVGQERQREGGVVSSDIGSLPVNYGEFLYLLIWTPSNIIC